MVNNKQIDTALEKFMSMAPKALEKYEPATIAEAAAKRLVVTATTSEDEALTIRTIQLIADRVEGRAAAQQKSGNKQEDFLKEIKKALNG